MKQTEHEHQKFVFQILALNEAKFPFLRFIYAVPNGGQRHPAVAAKLKAEGVKRGVSDICIPFSCQHNFRDPSGSCCPGAYIEMKAPKGKVSPEQKEFLEFVKEQGYFATVAYSCDEALDGIENYCGLKLRGRVRPD